jgi:hypothetical protein
LPLPWFEPRNGYGIGDRKGMVTCLRSVLMKPEHEAWLDRIWQRLMAACEEGIGD